MPEEIWFWTSKLLNDEINSKALDAIEIQRRSTPKRKHALANQNQTTSDTAEKGKFWPIVRERIEEKAIQLYLKDHPETQEPPAMKELRKTGYIETTKTITPKEIQDEKKAKQL